MTDQFFMEKALEQALQAYEQDEVPIGAILVSNLHIIGRGQGDEERGGGGDPLEGLASGDFGSHG